jgi:hypothetical protein
MEKLPNWIHCNKCNHFITRNTSKLYAGQCSHIICSQCLKVDLGDADQQTCPLCDTKTIFIPLDPQNVPDGIVDVFIPVSQHLQRLYETVKVCVTNQFQENNKTEMIEFLQKVCIVQNQQLSELQKRVHQHQEYN